MAIPTQADNLTDVPTASEYKEAFLQCRPAMKGKKYLEMLRANYHAEDHTITAEKMALAVDFDTYNQANLRYGAYSKELAKALGRTVKVNISILVTFSEGEDRGEAFVRWTMHPQVVAALEELGWVRTADVVQATRDARF